MLIVEFELFPLLDIFSCYLSFADIFEKQIFRKILSEIPSQYRAVLPQIWSDVLFGMIGVKTVFKVISR